MLNGRSPLLMAPVGEDVEYKQVEVEERGGEVIEGLIELDGERE